MQPKDNIFPPLKQTVLLWAVSDVAIFECPYTQTLIIYMEYLKKTKPQRTDSLDH